MKKAIAILLVLLVAGVVFGVEEEGSTIVLNANNADKLDLTIVQALGVSEESEIDLSTDSTTFTTSANLKVADWELFSNYKNNLRLEFWTDGGFKSPALTAASLDDTVDYKISFDGGTTYYTASTTDSTNRALVLLERAGVSNSGVYLADNNAGDITIQRADTNEYLAADDYVTTVTVSITSGF
jgi:hypothetical protein